METRSDKPSPADRLVAGLGHLGGCNDDQVSEQIAAALMLAGGSGTEAGEAERLDRALVAALVGPRGPVGLEVCDPGLLSMLARRVAGRLRGPGETDGGQRRLAWDLLDAIRCPALLRRIEPSERQRWANEILELVEASELTVGPLFRHRAARYGSKVLFELHTAGRRRTVTWRSAASRVEMLARGLLALNDDPAPPPIAILSENRLESALLDLACLTSGLVNVLIPANATDADVGYILRHAKVGTVIVSGNLQLRKVAAHRDSLPDLRTIVTLDEIAGQHADLVTLDRLTALAEKTSPGRVIERSEAVRVDDLATVMYTSGTTGTPKGIQFSQRNIVVKRFARALALPEIGDEDVFLCFLPLFHTFGRFLEMLGCIFWGAKYCFLASTSSEGLERDMRLYRPTVFISVPKKWLQLYERITQHADPLKATDEECLSATRRITGGRLAWGLSAAGHLDSDVFRFFQQQGVELVSGFGMTEATGGITMTPPGHYRDGSLGLPLPGIEAVLADDGEMLIRGPYVMMGYLDPPDGEGGFDSEGWMPTGDLMQVDDQGHFRLVDRKKEIYKNVKGETIAPQRVENHFRDFESVGRAFLVGDHREYNTLLIHPNPGFEELDFSTLSREETQDYFRSLVVSVNQFLAPYERIVDFALIDRDLDPEQGEVTPKGTPRRKTVERNFADTVRQLYRRTDLRVGGLDVIFPNWMLQILGLTAQNIRCEDDRIFLPSCGTGLTVRRVDEDSIQIGSCRYRWSGRSLNLGQPLTSPPIWLGNDELAGFAPMDLASPQPAQRRGPGMTWSGRIAPYHPSDEDRRQLEEAAALAEPGLRELDLAARLAWADDETIVIRAIDFMKKVLEPEESPLANLTRMLMGRLASSPLPAARRRAFEILLSAETEVHAHHVLRRFLVRDPSVLDERARDSLKDRDLTAARLEVLIDIAQEICLDDSRPEDENLDEALLGFLAEYGAGHPVRFRRLRAFLERMCVFGASAQVRARAGEAARRLERGFRLWLGPTSSIAVDPETGQEYRWQEVAVFDDAVPDDDRKRILSAIRETVFLREGVFLFSTGANIRLSDIPPRGIWIRLLGSLHGKAVYRITVQTRFQGAYDLAVNLNHDLTAEEVREEIRWLILSGDPGNRDPLVEDFGGYWPEQDLWSEEFIAGETLYRALRRLARQPAHEERFRQRWPFMVWATLSAYVEFWHRSGKQLELAGPGTTNVVVPTEDYQSGVRLVSVTRRRPHSGILSMMRTFREEFIDAVEEQYPVLGGLAGWSEIFSSVLEVIGEEEGLALFREGLETPETTEEQPLREALQAFVEEVSARGFVPLRLYFAIARYWRWAGLSADATLQARALTVQELYDTYGLQQLVEGHPEIRVRFFRETVFRRSAAPLAEGLDRIIHRIRKGELAPEDLMHEVDELRAPGPAIDDEYFLARLSYPFLRPEDAAVFVRSDVGGKRQSEIVVTLQDDDGNPFRVRHALNPKEVERLHRLFLAAKLDVRFRMEHHYLVAVNERGQLIGGIYYEINDESQTAHLEKIVVAERYRRQGVADGLMLEFFNRLRAAGLGAVTTGFFRPEYFYGYGFRIEKRYAGLVKSLAEEPPASSPPSDGASAGPATEIKKN